MTTAVLYSGEARTFAQLLENHQWHLLRHLNNPEIFVSVQDDEDSRAMERLHELPYKVHIEYHQQPDTLPWRETAEPPHLAGYNRSASLLSVYRQFWALQRVWDFYIAASRVAHDAFVRVRPDTKFLHLDVAPLRRQLHVPWWSSWGGINDRFAVMTAEVAPHYFNAVETLAHMGTAGGPLHPEKALFQAVQDFSIYRDAFDFVTLRKDGKVEPMDGTLCDLARMLKQ